MNQKDIFREIGSIDEKYIQEADIVMNKNGVRKPWVKIVSVAACFALIIGIGISFVYNQSNTIKLTNASNNASVKYVNNAPSISVFGDLEELSEEELFSKHDTDILKGTILKINNIQLNMNGQEEYRAIAQIKVEKVYRGDCKVGNTLSILLPSPIRADLWTEHSGTVSAMKAGMTGIFMPTKYTENSYYQANGAKLALTDIAEYSFADGERYAFLKTENGVIFSKWAYKSIDKATALEEIEAYIESMLK